MLAIIELQEKAVCTRKASLHSALSFKKAFSDLVMTASVAVWTISRTNNRLEVSAQKKSMTVLYVPGQLEPLLLEVMW